MNQRLDTLEGRLHRDTQHILTFSAIERERAVRRHARDRLGEVVVEAIDAAWILLRRLLRRDGQLRAHHPLAEEERPRSATHRRILHDRLGADVARPGQRRLGGFHTRLGVDKGCRGVPQRLIRRTRQARLAEDQIGERLQSTLASDAGARLALGPVGQVKVIYLLKRRARQDGHG
jgi:hypothetical protein